MQEKILEIVSDITKISTEILLKDREKEKLWNSLTHIELIIMLENEFNIEFNDEELAQLTTISKIIELMERKVS